MFFYVFSCRNQLFKYIFVFVGASKHIFLNFCFLCAEIHFFVFFLCRNAFRHTQTQDKNKQLHFGTKKNPNNSNKCISAPKNTNIYLKKVISAPKNVQKELKHVFRHQQRQNYNNKMHFDTKQHKNIRKKCNFGTQKT